MTKIVLPNEIKNVQKIKFFTLSKIFNNLYCIEEIETIDAAFSYLKWDYGLTVYKNDACRVALHSLLEDFKNRRRDGLAVARLKKKKPRR